MNRIGAPRTVIGEWQVVIAAEPARVVWFAGAEIAPGLLVVGLPAVAIRTLGLVEWWSEWRQRAVYGPIRVGCFGRLLALDAVECAGDHLRLGSLLLDHLQLVVQPDTNHVTKSPANCGEWVLDMFRPLVR